MINLRDSACVSVYQNLCQPGQGPWGIGHRAPDYHGICPMHGHAMAVIRVRADPAPLVAQAFTPSGAAVADADVEDTSFFGIIEERPEPSSDPAIQAGFSVAVVCDELCLIVGLR